MSQSRSFSQRSSSQPKKQATISSFFTPKSTSQPKIASPLSQKSTQGQQDDQDASLFVTSDDDAPATRRTSSKRNASEEGSDVENRDPSSNKRRRIIDDVDEDITISHPRAPVAVKSALPPTDADSSSASKPAPASSRTSKYIFSSSPVIAHDGEPEEDTEDSRRYKERMHLRFVKKLGRPDSVAEIKRRNNFINDTTESQEGAEDDEAEEEEPAPRETKGKPKGGARANGKLTPMELQYLEIKRKHMDTILVYQVGYKYRIFGEDARIAAKELGLVCIPGKFRYDDNSSGKHDLQEKHYNRFASCSFPVARLHVHVKRLVQAGHKVGVVKQLETAALKAIGDNRNAPFVRKLTNVYTKGTYVDDVEGLEGPVAAPSIGAPATGYLLCLTESNARGWGNDEKVHVGLVAVQPATGSIIYDDFEDGFMRTEIETRLLHIAPCEYLIVGDLSGATDKLITHLSASKSNVFRDKARVDRIGKPKTMAAQSYSHISNFYAGKMQPTGSRMEDEMTSHTLDKVHQLSEHVTICLSSMITHLTEYGLEHIFDLTKNFQPFSARTHMLLNGNTLNSLEIYRNQTDHTEQGSLFWTLDRTKTRFGKRLLRNWVGRPLLDKAKLEKRTAAVEELLSTEKLRSADRLKGVVSSVRGDLEKVLVRIYYKKASRPELLSFLQTLQRVANEFAHVKTPEDTGFDSGLLNEAIATLPRIGDKIVEYLDRINLQSAKQDDKYSFFRPEHETEGIQEHTLGIATVEQELDEHRAVAAQKLGKKKVEYVTVALNEYLIEVQNDKMSLAKVPASWTKISGTKKVSRFQTPEVVKMIRERDQHKEALASACDTAYEAFLGEISASYQELRDTIQALAVLDCLLSLADVAAQPDYVKPTFCDEPRMVVTQGRHPMVEQLVAESYIPNDVCLSSVDASTDPSGLLITGPNMGGKSSYVRSVALIAIMGQIGSYVPAESAELGMLDAVFTRMGAFDNMMRGESTFMVELGETSDILKQATTRSLVILDELGRGTSTHDGVAIAEAVLKEMVSRKVMTLFVTHYQDLARLEPHCPGLKNVHMKFRESGEEGKEEITFLYEVGEGVAHRSYGLNVARLANVPKAVLEVAAVKSKELEESVEKRKVGNL
jgi:DNA mismatch repair protein MSH3